MLAAEHLAHLARLYFGGEFIEARGEVGADILPLLRPLHEDGEVIGAGAQRQHEVGVFLEAAAALQHLLRGRLIVPEAGRGGLLFERRNQLRDGVRVKDSSAGRPPASRGPGNAGSVRPNRWPRSSPPFR